ncbi:MAG TPA: plastocyanin/azurin family copper-binding protein [Gemmatimonadaceae bacterium]
MRQFRLVACFGLAAALGACGGSGSSSLSTSPGGTNPGGGTPTPTTNLVTLVNSAFSPSTITVTAGATVNWKWNDCSGGDGYGGGGATCVTHQITFDDGSGIASASQDQGTFSRTFSSKGTYKYHCLIHGAAMSGEVDVQ